jgi:hypothetical protein
MELEIGGIKCDTPHCNYRDDSVKFEEYPKWINKPCPLCSKNLLTQADYDKCIKLQKTIKIITALRWINPFFYIKSVFRLITGSKTRYNNLNIKYENDGSVTKHVYKSEK